MDDGDYDFKRGVFGIDRFAAGSALFTVAVIVVGMSAAAYTLGGFNSNGVGRWSSKYS